MNANDKETLIILAIPIVGLVYCGIVIGSMIASPTLRNHAPLAAGIAVMLPLIVGVSLWIRPKE